MDDTDASRSRCFTTLTGDEEDGRDLFLGPPLLAQCLEGAELVEGMQRHALHVLGKRVLFGRISAPASRTMQGTGAVFARRFCFTSSSRAR